MKPAISLLPCALSFAVACESKQPSGETQPSREIPARTVDVRSAAPFTASGILLEINGGWRQVGAATVGSSFFQTGDRPILGRALGAADFEGVAPVAVVAEQFWRDVLAADPSVIGRKIKTDGTPGGSLTIVGVMPKAFGASGGMGLWLPRRDSTRKP
jgi:hypothetical protein